MIFIDIVLCELVTNHGTTSVYIEGLDANPDPTLLLEIETEREGATGAVAMEVQLVARWGRNPCEAHLSMTKLGQHIILHGKTAHSSWYTGNTSLRNRVRVLFEPDYKV